MADIMSMAKKHALQSIKEYMKELEARQMKEPSEDENMAQADFHRTMPDAGADDFGSSSSKYAAYIDPEKEKEEQMKEGYMDHRPAPGMEEEESEEAEMKPEEQHAAGEEQGDDSINEVKGDGEDRPEPKSGDEEHDEDDSWKAELIHHYDQLSKKTQGTGNMGEKELKRKGY